MKLGPVVALLVLLNAGVTFAAQEIFDTMRPDELSAETTAEDFGVTVGAPQR